MAIINLPKARAKQYSTVLDQDKTYYFVQVVHAFEVPSVLDNVPIEILEFIRHGEIYLIISNEFECFDEVVEEVYNSIIIPNKVPENKILFLSGAVEISSISKNVTDKINKLNNTSYTGINSKFFSWYEYAVAYYYKTSTNNTGTEMKRHLALQGKINYKKHYLLMNHRWRFHRPTLVAILKVKNLLDYGYVSLGSNDGNSNWENVYDALLNYNHTNSEIYNLLVENKNYIQNTPDLVLDKEDKSDTTYRSYFYRTIVPYFETSFMSIVTETYFYDRKTKFFSEKTFKPIAFLQPFILVSVPYSLETLRNMGYKTFHPYIDESYDIEEDNATRMKMIIDEIERISKLSLSELKQLSLDCRNICLHNQKLLLSKYL